MSSLPSTAHNQFKRFAIQTTSLPYDTIMSMLHSKQEHSKQEHSTFCHKNTELADCNRGNLSTNRKRIFKCILSVSSVH